MDISLHYYGDPVLRKHCSPVESIDDEIRELARAMIYFADGNNGIGISAPQIGRAIRMFVIRKYIIPEDGSPWEISSEFYTYINPKITILDKTTAVHNEGCMSLPRLQVSVARPVKIKIEAYDIDGKHFTEVVEGYNARVLQHEYDHLNGVLHIDRTTPKEKKKIKKDLEEMKKRYSSSS